MKGNLFVKGQISRERSRGSAQIRRKGAGYQNERVNGKATVSDDYAKGSRKLRRDDTADRVDAR